MASGYRVTRSACKVDVSGVIQGQLIVCRQHVDIHQTWGQMKCLHIQILNVFDIQNSAKTICILVKNTLLISLNGYSINTL